MLLLSMMMMMMIVILMVGSFTFLFKIHPNDHYLNDVNVKYSFYDHFHLSKKKRKCIEFFTEL